MEITVNIVDDIEYVTIAHEDGSFTSMTKAHWDSINANTEGTR